MTAGAREAEAYRWLGFAKPPLSAGWVASARARPLRELIAALKDAPLSDQPCVTVPGQTRAQRLTHMLRLLSDGQPDLDKPVAARNQFAAVRAVAELQAMGQL